ncbi:MAG: hypothetical protein V3R85_02795 [Alphaproteobacteria bacterium]
MRERNRYNYRMFEIRNLLARPLLPRHRHDDLARLHPDQPFETVDGDFDDVPLDDLYRQASTGRIDVADL